MRRVVRECVGDTLSARRRGRRRRTSFGAASPAGAVAILATCACAGPLVPMARGAPVCTGVCAVWCVERFRAAPWGGGLAARGRPSPRSEHSVGQRRTPRARRFATSQEHALLKQCALFWWQFVALGVQRCAPKGGLKREKFQKCHQLPYTVPLQTKWVLKEIPLREPTYPPMAVSIPKTTPEQKAIGKMIRQKLHECAENYETCRT